MTNPTIQELEEKAKESEAHEFPVTEIHNSTVLSLTALVRELVIELQQIAHYSCAPEVSRDIASKALTKAKEWGL